MLIYIYNDNDEIRPELFVFFPFSFVAQILRAYFDVPCPSVVTAQRKSS